MEPELYLCDRFLSKEEADKTFSFLYENAPWEQDVYHFGVAPRLTALYGVKDYVYSGMRKHAYPIIPEIQELLDRIEALIDVRFNSILLNLYRNGKDSIGWHADDEPELGHNPLIGTLSLGTVRNLDFKHNVTKEEYALALEHGDFCIMGESVQSQWKHRISKSNAQNKRISLTFRQITP